MKKKENWLLLLLFAFIMTVEILPRQLGNLDELWNYNFIRNMTNGLLPYQDFNMVQMPFFPLFGSLFFKVLGADLINMRILGILLSTFIIFMVYQILKQILKNKYISCTFTLLILWLYKDYFCFDYNFLILGIALLILWFELKEEKTGLHINLKKDILLGILAGFAITFKQSTGLVLVGIFVIYKWLYIGKKEDVKVAFQISCIRGFSALIPVLIMIIYVCLNHIQTQFIDYCLLGIQTFDNNISYKNFWNQSEGYIKILATVLPVLIIIFMYITLRYRQKNEFSKNIVLIFCYGVATCIVIYPIADVMHFLIGSLFFWIGLCYLLVLLIRKMGSKIKGMEKVKNIFFTLAKSLLLATIAVIVFLQICFFYQEIKNYEKNTFLHYQGIPIEEGLKKRIQEEITYIQQKEALGKQVIILDGDAPVIMIPLDKYHKNYDMLLKGNLGAKGAQGVIEQIEKEEALFLIRNEKFNLNWQFPKEVYQYVKQNMKQIDSFSIYDVYEKTNLK